jgi:type I restriction enzyme, S subunit
MNYRAYPTLRQSRHSWLNKIPTHWDSVNVRLISRRYSGGTPDKSNSLFWIDGTVPWLNSGEVNQGVIIEPTTYITEEALAASSAKWVPPNAIVIALAGQGKTKGMAAITTFKTTCNQSMAAVVYESDHPKFMYWWLVSQYKNIRGMASDDARDGLNLEMIATIPCPRPTIREQQNIAAFLDWKTSQIDALIAKKKKLIDKLKEKRLAIITQAVTNGLDIAAPVRDSGIPWLGAVPLHWVLNYKLGFLSASEKNSFVNGPFGSDLLTTELVNEGVPVIYSGDVKATRFLRKSGKYVTAEKALSLDFCRVDEGDVLLAKVGDPPGDACVYPLGSPPAVVTQDVVRIKVDRRTVDPKFLSYLLVSEMGRYLVRLVSVEATRGRFSLADLQSIRFPVPPLSEQVEIAAHISSELLDLDRMNELNETAIARLTEYRTALITAAVTGQIDVRHIAVPDPA